MEPNATWVPDDSIKFVAGRLFLDFVNTACRRLGEPIDFAATRHDLNLWLSSAEAIHGKRIDPQTDWTAEEDRSLADAHELRTALWELVGAHLERRSPVEGSVAIVNRYLAADPTFAVLSYEAGAFRHAIRSTRRRAPWLTEIAIDAVDFFTNADLELLRQCECATCVRVFYDTTKNHTRRWCVERCGSRVKAANYYRRKRAKALAQSQS